MRWPVQSNGPALYERRAICYSTAVGKNLSVWIESPFDSLPVEGFRKQRYWLMAEAFVRAGHDVVYWTSDFSHATKAPRRLVDASAAGSFSLRLLKTPPYRRNVGLARVRSHRAYAHEWARAATDAAAREGRPDLIVVSAPPLATGPVAVRLARQFGATLVVDVQDAWPETFVRLLPRGLGGLGRLLFAPARASIRRVYRAADLVTGVCDRYEALVRSAGARDYYRAYLGIESLGPWPRPPRADDAPTRLVYVGNLGRSYDLATVVEGMRRLAASGARVTLDVAGFGGEAPADASVRVHGLLDRERLAALLASCDVGVVPMRADSFVGVPNKLMEYAAAGLPVVSSLAGETARLLDTYDCGATYAPGDAAGFADAVRAAAAKPSAAARKMAAREFLAGPLYDAYVERVAALARA